MIHYLSRSWRFVDTISYILNKISNFDLIIKPLDLLLKYFKNSIDTFDEDHGKWFNSVVIGLN